MAELSFGIALRGDDLAQSKVAGRSDGLDDLMGGVDIRADGIEEIGMSAEGGEFDTSILSHRFDLGGMGVQAH